MKYFMKIFGCQMNYSDAERITTLLEKYKFKSAASVDAADLILFVTCGVRQSAEDRVYGQVNNIKKKYPGKTIILTGCLAHRKDVQRRLKGKVDLFTTIQDFPKEINKILNTKYQTLDTKNKPCNDYLKIAPSHTNNYQAFVPIMTGCNNFCAYCVVPYARGREYSRPAEDILKETRGLIKKGYKEIVLLGQNVNSYISGAINFPKLLKSINVVPGNFWLTFLTSHPKDISDELIETIAKSKKICEYISLPAQSGNNKIISRMNRHYTITRYKTLIKKIRQASLRLSLRESSEDLVLGKTVKLPPAISTDIIVGFPGETRKQFEDTAKLLREMKYDMAYIAQYSPRPQTAAWKLKDNVTKAEKVRREKVLTKILKKTAFENNKRYVGKTVEVLIDKNIPNLPDSPNLPKKYSAHTRTQKKVVFFSYKKISVGSFRKIKITRAKTFGLEGKTT